MFGCNSSVLFVQAYLARGNTVFVHLWNYVHVFVIYVHVRHGVLQYSCVEY